MFLEFINTMTSNKHILVLKFWYMLILLVSATLNINHEKYFKIISSFLSKSFREKTFVKLIKVLSASIKLINPNEKIFLHY